MLVKQNGGGLVLAAATPEEREALKAFVDAGASKTIILAEVSNASDKPEGPTEIRLSWAPAET